MYMKSYDRAACDCNSKLTELKTLNSAAQVPLQQPKLQEATSLLPTQVDKKQACKSGLQLLLIVSSALWPYRKRASEASFSI